MNTAVVSSYSKNVHITIIITDMKLAESSCNYITREAKRNAPCAKQISVPAGHEPEGIE